METIGTADTAPARFGRFQRLHLRTWSGLGVAAAYVVMYLVLDRLSYVGALRGFDITPWNPQPGLTLALLIVGGFAYVPVFTFAELVASQVTPASAVPLWVGLVVALIVSGGYAGAAYVLRSVLKIDPRLHRAWDVILLIAVVSVTAGVVAIGFAGIYTLAGLLPVSEFLEALVHLWIGNAIGAIVFAPLVLVAVEYLPHRWPKVFHDLKSTALEAFFQWASIAGALALVFDFEHHRAELFYLLFLPLVWIAARRGLPGTVCAIFTIQIGLIGCLETVHGSPETIRTFQLFMLAVAITGLILGAFVSDRRRIVEALADSQGRLSTILNTARDGVLTIDTEGRIGAVNPSVERLFLRPAHTLIGRNIRDLIDTPGFLENLKSATFLPVETARWEFNARHADGSLFPVELSVGPFGLSGEENYTIVIRDIRLRRDAEARERAHQTELSRVSRLSLAGEIASALAHELNQPLTAIAAYARGCLRMLPDPGQAMLKDGIEEVVQQAERAADVIVRLREFIRTGSLRRTIVEVRDVVESAAALVRSESEQAGIDIDAQIPSGLPPVFIDRIQVEQVILNLLRNGMDAVSNSQVVPRRIILNAKHADQGAVEIAISDNGPGVSAEMQEGLFKPFVTSKPHGMGLGLVISHSIIEAHGGRLRYVANAKPGATFAFDLPVAASNEVDHGS